MDTLARLFAICFEFYQFELFKSNVLLC